MIKRVVVGLTLALFCLDAVAQDPPRASGLPAGLPEEPAPPPATEEPEFFIDIQRLEAKPVLDGKLNEPAWETAAVFGNFTQYEPEEGAQPTQPTEVRVGYDEENLYFGVRCFDSEPGKILASIKSREGDLSNDDSVKIILDTFHDRKNGIFFMVNSIGAMVDGLVRNEGEEENTDWDGLWYAVPSRDEQGWSVEIAIPFKTLRFANAESQDWGFNMRRFIARRQEESFWRPIHRSWGYFARYKISEYGEIRGLKNLKPFTRYQATPYFITRSRRPEKKDDSTTGDAGGDFRINLTSQLVADLTVNTDFAEVEADQQQVNLSRFKLFYPEKRDFFLEGANLFYFGDRIEPYDVPERFIFFFSRQIGLTLNGLVEVPILGGGKVSGKIDDVSVGFLNLTTDSLRYDTALGKVEEPQTNYTVLRLKKDIYPKSTIGLIGLNKDASGGGSNRGGGFDWNLALGQNFSSIGFLTKTWTPGFEGDDTAVSGDLVFQKKKLRVRQYYADIGENFNPEMGFITRTGIRKSQTDVALFLTPQKYHVHKLFVVGDLNYITGQDGEIQSRVAKYELNFISRSKAGVAFLWFDNLEVLDRPLQVHKGVVIPPGRYRFKNLFTGIGSDYSKDIGFTLWYDQGSYYSGERLHTLISVATKLREGLLIVTSWDRNDVDLPEGDFTTDIIQSSAVYSITPTLGTRLTLQYNKEDNFRANFLVEWVYRPGSNFYFVYNDLRELDDLRRHAEFSTLAPGRSVIVKVTRRFDF